MNARLIPAPANGDLDAFWMPYTANRQFKANPRLLARAEGMHYWTADGREIDLEWHSLCQARYFNTFFSRVVLIRFGHFCTS